MNREQCLEERRSGAGGSDIAPMLGLSPWKTPLELWQDKTGRAVENISPEQAERMYWGNTLEDVVARHYAEQRGVRVQRINGLIRHPEHPIAFANIDRAVVVEGSRARWTGTRVEGASRILECKTAHALAQNSAEWGEPATDEVPRHYWLQCQWYLGITGLPFADLAVLFGGQRFVTYTILSDAALFADLLAEAVSWWERYVVADMPPQPRTEDEARRLWSSHVAGRELVVDVKVSQAVHELVEVKASLKALEEHDQQLKDTILPAFGDAEAISCGGVRLATWRANKSSEKTDWRAVAVALGAEQNAAIVAQNTATIPGARVLRLNTKEITK